MITREKAKDLLAENHPDLKIKASVDLDSEWYVFAAVPDDTRNDYIGPMYAVNKQNGSLKYYHPNADIERFSRACDKSLIEY